MVKIGWIVLFVVALAILAQSETTTRKPRARKVSLSKSLSLRSNSSMLNDKKKIQPVSSEAKKTLSVTGRVIEPARKPANISYAVRRNPASLQRSAEPEIPNPDPVNPTRLKDDMQELGLDVSLDSNDNSNTLNVLEPPRSIPVSRPRPRPRPSVSRPRSPPQQRYPPPRNDNYDPFADYEDLLFDEYDQPLEDNKFLAESLPSGKYLSSEVCGRKLYCQRGNRGPCNRNEVFLPLFNDSKSITRPSCGSLLSYPWNGCLSSGKVGVAAASSATSGSCAVRFPQRPCYGYPTNYRYYSPTRRCYPGSNGWEFGVMNSGPCPLNKVFMDIDGINGMCQCRDRNQLLYKGDDRCHRIYTKGPCGYSQWLEPDTNGYGTCRPSPCPENKCDGRHIYWKPTPNSDGGCYKSFTRGPCRRGSYFLVEDYGTRRGRCVSQYGSSFNPLTPYAIPARYPVMRNPYDMMYSNSMMSPWSKFGMYPPFGMQTPSFGMQKSSYGMQQSPFAAQQPSFAVSDYEDDYEELPNLDY